MSMRSRHWLTRGAAVLAAAVLAVSAKPVMISGAADYNLGYSTNPSENDYIYTTRTPRGRIGKSMTISFRIPAFLSYSARSR